MELFKNARPKKALENRNDWMIPLGQCIICGELCWIDVGWKARASIVKTQAGFMHDLCYIYKGKRLVDKEARIQSKGSRYNAYNRDKRAWV